MTQNITIYHCSDSHIWSKDTKFDRKIFTYLKRLECYLFVKLYRKNAFSLDVFKKVLQEITKKDDCDHLLFSGDLTNIGMQEELSLGRKYIEDYYLKQKISQTKRTERDLFTITCGNHDISVEEDVLEFQNKFGKYFSSSFAKVENEKEKRIKKMNEIFPNIKFLDHLKIVVINMNSAIPSKFMQCAGRLKEEIEKTKKMLDNFGKEKSTKLKDFFKIVVVHHCPVFRSPNEFIETHYNIDKREREQFKEFCLQRKIHLVSCGHVHQFQITPIEGEGFRTLCVDSGSCNRVLTENSFCVYKIDTKKKVIRIEKRFYNKTKKCFESEQPVVYSNHFSK